MQQRERWQIVSLSQRECRARNFQFIVLREIADQRACGGGFPRTQIAGQRDDVACAEQQREIGH